MANGRTACDQVADELGISPDRAYKVWTELGGRHPEGAAALVAKLAERATLHPEGTRPFAWWMFEAQSRPALLYCKRGHAPDSLPGIIEAEREQTARLMD